MNRKALVIFSLLALSVFCIGAASALDLGDSTSQAENITLDSITFQIPAGFEEEKALALDNEKDSISGISYTTNGKTFSKGSEIISIGVATYDGYEVDDQIASMVGNGEKTVNDVKGYDYSDDNFSGFVYAKNGKIVIISVTDEALLEEVVINEK